MAHRYGLCSSTSPSVDPKVTNQEDENIKKSSGPPSNMEAQLARRPGYGQEGTHVALFANYFRVNASKDLYLYAVEMEPEVKIRDHRKMVYTELFKQLGEAMRKAITTDYSKQIVASCILGPLKDSYSIEYTPSHNTAVGKRSIKLTLKLSSTISVSMLHRYLSGDDDTYNESQAIQALNIILARVPSSSENCVCKGSKFFPRDQTDLETFKILSYIPGVVAVKGYYSSVRTSTSRLLCNINICTSAFYEPAALHMYIISQPNYTTHEHELLTSVGE